MHTPGQFGPPAISPRARIDYRVFSDFGGGYDQAWPVCSRAACRPREGDASSSDSRLEGNGFEISVPRQEGCGFEASVGLGPIDSRRGGTTRAVVGHGKPIWFADSALEGNGFEPSVPGR